MQITILNGEGEAGSRFESYLFELERRLAAQGHAMTRLDLARMNLKGCSGCFGCWVKTPGICVKRDDSAIVCRSAIGADLLLLASPMKMGFTSVLLKRSLDQMIPLLHPYFCFEGGEIHHRARYQHYPQMGLLLGVGDDCDEEDVEITTRIWQRTARNLKASLVLVATTNQEMDEVAHELAGIA